MGDSPFQLDFDDLPRVLPLFPLSGVLMLPRGELPLNVFEPRYLNMVLDSLGEERMVGILQPARSAADPIADDARLLSTGCAGRITAFQETSDRRLLVTLTGVCRFRLGQEVDSGGGYRRAVVDYSDYKADMIDDGRVQAVDRQSLLRALKTYGAARSMQVEWNSLDGVDDEVLVHQLAMGLPFAPNDKQALLEAPDLIERGRILTALLDMAALQGDDESDDAGTRH
ncbi:LON peptidase substrate-binding domain-containing protein [Magnetospira sp. QH-2]|uniref:LON peptidase substrate-binding domain-containing protein n=1 Tax=Magnetospira sp. (strain QH-2) TaxID=1288970 RepID=UPI0003E81988|nr:LON peptidase substrate-binding domain-containing protein [Magnetospira sp. QH-2]CCQ75296.1 putative Lon family ATP-dependent protease [Magnetospira sp. QH-2]